MYGHNTSTSDFPLLILQKVSTIPGGPTKSKNSTELDKDNKYRRSNLLKNSWKLKQFQKWKRSIKNVVGRSG